MKKSNYQWMLENWAIYGGLVTPATAAKLLEVSKTRVTQLTKEKKLTKLLLENQVLITDPEVIKLAREREYKIFRSQIEEDIKGVKDIIPEEFLSELKEGLEKIIKTNEEIIN